MKPKNFKLDASKIIPLAQGFGTCYATDRITVEGLPVRFMYREAPDDSSDSGWRFFSGVDEDEEYVASPDNIAIYNVNTIANYDRTIIPHLESPVGSCFEKWPDQDEFTKATLPGEDE